MSPQQNDIIIEDEGFVTTKKGLTLSSMALFIWLLTSICYKTSTFIFEPDYVTFCFFASLLFSILAGIYVSNILIKTSNVSSKIILIIANILLLYSSANGIQSGVCFVVGPNHHDNVQTSFILPFFEAKPWLPDKFQFTEIKALQDEKVILENKNRFLAHNVIELSHKIDALVADASPDEIQRLRIENFRLDSSLDSIRNKNVSQSVDYENVKAEAVKFRGLYSSLISNIKSFNSIQAKWNTQLNSNKNLYKIRNGIVELLGNDFCVTVLETPIGFNDIKQIKK